MGGLPGTDAFIFVLLTGECGLNCFHLIRIYSYSFAIATCRRCCYTLANVDKADRQQVDHMRKVALLWDKLPQGKVHCHMCAHACSISESNFGVCGVRQNIDGMLYCMTYGEIIAAHIDPIEKKPLYHFLPGSDTYSIASIGCNFKCGFCQNWQISQASIHAGGTGSGNLVTPEQTLEKAIKNNCASISYTYTEPTIFFEYAFDTARLAHQAGLANIFVTNGYISREALQTIAPYLDAANVDLKGFTEDFYKKNCHAHLKPVLDTIVSMKEMGIWLEVTTLVIPGANDSDLELTQLADFIAQLGNDVPWHLSRFHPGYLFLDRPATPIETLRRAREIGRNRGLRHIYLGNVLEGTNTYCYRCQALITERRYMGLERQLLKDKGLCPSCGTAISGFWS